MRRSILALLLLAVAGQAAQAQLSAPALPASARIHATDSVTTISAAAEMPIDDYIHQSWDTLTRSMKDCTSLADPKLKTDPILYLPRELAMPPEVKALQQHCRVRVERLPVRVAHFGTIKLADIPVPGLLYLPNRYVVPGGRFNEMYGWDSYFILLGLLDDHKLALGRGMVENFFFEIEHYGGILNANRTYYFTRSQPPFLSAMIRAVYDAEVEAGHPQEANQWLRRAYGFAQRDHALWMRPMHRAGDTGLARYFDTGDGPVPEMADDSTYYPDVIRWLLAHPQVQTNYLLAGAQYSATQLASLSCDPHSSSVCARAHVQGYWLTRDFYKGDRAMRESGFDTSFHFGPFSGSTHHYASVALNSLLYRDEQDLAWMAERLQRSEEARVWSNMAKARRAAMDRYLWNPQRQMYFDYDFTTHRQSSYSYLTTFYPLWVGAADRNQAAGVIAALHLFEHPGGLAMSAVNSGVQWDLPYGWAPTQWIAVEGMLRAGDRTDAQRVAAEFAATVSANYRRDHTIHEKYDVTTESSEFQVTAGYRQNVVGFGWTNAVYLELESLALSSIPGPAGTMLR